MFVSFNFILQADKQRGIHAIQSRIALKSSFFITKYKMTRLTDETILDKQPINPCVFRGQEIARVSLYICHKGAVIFFRGKGAYL